MARAHDVIVLGLGGMGSAAACFLAERGARVLGLEKFVPPHDHGSSHGRSRIIRLAYFEHPDYVPLLLRAYELFEKLEADTGASVLTLTGGLMAGREHSEVVSGSIASARAHDLPHEILDAADIKRRFPAFDPDPDVVALYEAKAGYLVPEDTVAAYLERAARLGAHLRFQEPALAWSAAASGDGVTVTTPADSYEAARLVVCPGSWAPVMLADLNLPLVVERQIMYWIDPIGGIDPFLPDRFPIYIYELPDGVQFYGFPAQDGAAGGIKVAFFRHNSVVCTPETIDRTVHQHESDEMRMRASRGIPALAGRSIAAKTCMYTSTPDQHFVIALYPGRPQVAIAAGFSGHGFKFTSVVGEILADLALDGKTRHPIALFAPERFEGR
jgi:sarcosine oxidase